MPWQRIRRLFPMELQSFGDKSLKWYRHKILANNHIDSAAAAVVSKMTWHDPSTSLKFSSFSMRDFKRPLKRITYSKIRVFSQNWFCGGDICVSGLICLSCSLLVSLTLHVDCHNVTSIHSWVNNLLLLLYLLILLSKTKHFSMYRHESIGQYGDCSTVSHYTGRHQTGSCSVSMRPWQYSGSDNIKLDCSITITAACLPMLLHKCLITISDMKTQHKKMLKFFDEKWNLATMF